MAWPWLAIVARNIPWTELARRAPKIIADTKQLLDKRNAVTGPDATTPPDEADEMGLEKRIRNLEEQDAEHARVFEELAKQSRDLSDGLQVLAARLRLLTWIVATAVVLGVFGFIAFV